MRSRPTFWILLILLCMAGAWLLFHQGSRRTIAGNSANSPANPGAASVATSTKSPAAGTAAANAMKIFAEAKTNRFAFRLSNTTKSLGALVNDPRAILLENALIDTRLPLNLAIPKNLQAKGDPGAYIVQAHGPTDGAFRAMLAASGAQIVSYIPNNAYLVTATGGVADQMTADGYSVVPFEPYYKISVATVAGSMQKLASAAPANFKPRQPTLLELAVEQKDLPAKAELNLGLFAANTAATIQQIQKLGGNVLATNSSPFGPELRVQPPANWTALADLPGVQIVEPYHERVHANDLSRPTVGVSLDSITQSNYMNLYGSNVIVEVNDTGVDTNHPDFLTGGTAPLRVFFNDPANGYDTDGHGTFVAGEIAGDGTESITVTNAEGSINPGTNGQYRGKAPLAKLFAMNLNDPLGDQDLQQAAALTNALISNNSWGYGGDDTYDLAAASYDAATRDALPFVTGSQPVLFVFSAGNDGYNNDNAADGDNDGFGGNPDTICSPGTAKNVITVGALEQERNITNYVTDANGDTNTQPWKPETDTSYQVAYYSSRGNVGIGTEGAFGRYKPDVVAPGTFVISTRSQEWDTNSYYNPIYDHTSEIIDYVDAYTSTELPLQFFVYNNALQVTIQAATIGPGAPVVPLPIYVWPGTDPNTAAPVLEGTNFVTLSPTLAPDTGWACGISNTTDAGFTYDLIADVQTTNDLGNYYQVLEGMNDSLGGYYRYESGTSMSAADVSGVLALMEDFFTNQLQLTPSPALLKAMLINGARPTSTYNFQVDNAINYEGWGLINLPDSLPPGITNAPGTPCDNFFIDQNPTNALATGDSHTFLVTVSTNAPSLPLRVTLAWTDPPGNPAAAIKLVNNLTLIVTNFDNPTNPVVYVGNNIPAGSIYNEPLSGGSLTNSLPWDSINNIQNVYLPSPLGTNYSVTVIGRDVNVNAVTAQTNNEAGAFEPNIVQDFALVISCGEGEVTNAITVTNAPIISNPTADQNITYVLTNNVPLLNQLVGASSPLLGTNTVSLGTNTTYGTNAAVTVGQTNQWHFYVVVNNTNFANAAFVTFLPDTLAIPRMGVFADSDADSTRPEADIDLYVSTDPGLTNLNPTTISNCVNGAQIGASAGGVFNSSALDRGGTEFVVDTNSQQGQVYYVGVKSEDHEGSEYGFLPVFSQNPFSQNGTNGQVVYGVPLPVNIPNGSNAHPGVGYVFALALNPMEVQNVIVSNEITGQNLGNLIGTLNFNGKGVVLNNHDSIESPPPPGPYDFVYDDSQSPIAGSQPSDGPGSLTTFTGQQAIGPWILTEADDSLTQSNSETAFSMLIQPHLNPQKGVTVNIPPGSWYYNYVDVPLGYTNLSVFATNLPPTVTPPLQLYLNIGTQPDMTNYLETTWLTNGTPPGNVISYGPPLQPGTYWIGIFNPSSSTATAYLIATLNGAAMPPLQTDFGANGPVISDDAVTTNSIYVSATNQIESVNVGLVVEHPRISDLTFTLVSPEGQRILLMENRGGYDTNGAGSTYVYTNVLNSTATGGAAANTNYLPVDPAGGIVPITYNFYTVPDQMTVYDTTNASLFVDPGPNLLRDTGLTNNPPAPGGGAQNTLPETIDVPYPPGVSNITIIMNEFGNPDAGGGDAWTYTAGAQITNYQYLVFTEDTNLTTTPIKFAVPPFSFTPTATNYDLSDFELATNGDYLAPTNIYDAFGGWFMPTNELAGTNQVYWTNNLVSVVADPADSLGDNVGSNFLALAYGTITRTIPTVPNSMYTVTFWYRGPGIAGWWRGEGNATDSSDPENNGNNGSLIGRFNFPAGEVGQAFEFEDPGDPYEFAGTNTYVQIRQSPSLDVGAGGGLTVEGWINPTNISFQQPLVEWLAKVPTNTTDTNFNIVAGPFLDRATDHYYYLLGATNWTTSETWATYLGGHLATVDTANEENWIYDTFATYAGTNRGALWIGLNDTNNTPLTFTYSSGETNIAYTNWAAGQPNECTGNEHYVAIITATNALSGLWVVAANNGVSCTTPATNVAYGVVEVDNIQTNGVQFWISVTNTPGTTNSILSSNACLYADLVDVSNVTHEIYSAPGLIQSNIFQHVALTYSTNSGIANLYYDGTNVASTNLGVFVPKTGGDVLLGRDMNVETNNFYAGEMDEMSIYSRALSHAEILGIYQVSAFSTNRNIGKFDPTVTPAEGLAEAQVSFGTTTNVLYGQNKQWQVDSYTFTATSNSMPLQISGLEPGMLLDSFNVSETPLGNLYYLPEQSLDELDGESPNGIWTLEIWDNRTGAYITNGDQLINWQLQFVLQTNVLATPLATVQQQPTTITVPPGQTVYLSVAVPTWATFATNVLVSATAPVNLYFNQTNTPTGNVPPDTLLLPNSTGGIGLPVLSATPPSTPPLLPGQTYYLGVNNPGTHAVTAVVEVDFNITALTNGVPYTGVLYPTNLVRYFAFDVSSNAYEATFQLLNLSGNADLVVRKGPPLPTLYSDDYGSFNATNADENIYVLTNSQPVPLSAGRWYLGVYDRDPGPVNYTVLAKELDTTNGMNGYTVINLTNSVPVNFTAGPGAALTNFFRFDVTNNPSLTNAGAIRFELYNLSGNGDLTVQTNAPPFAPPFFQSSQQPGATPELIYVRTNSALTNLAADWYLGVPNNETRPISFTIEAVIDTNAYFPAFPGATGSGGGAMGAGHAGMIGTVYHVISTDDSGPGTLRAAICATNRTVVFDVSGTIGLLSPLVITNSYLTIAGQTAPGGGITVAGQMTVVTNVHDVIIRDVQFCSGAASGTVSNSFEGMSAADYTNGQIFAGWKVLTNQVSVVTDPTTSYTGSNFLALASGAISNTLPTVAGQTYTLSFAYHGPSIISWWRAESNANDSVAVNNGTFQNGATFASGEVGQAFNFNGVNQFVQAPDSPSLEPTNFTLECWFKDSSGNGALMNKPVGAGDNDSYSIWLQNGNLTGVICNAGTQGQAARISFTPVHGVWYHVAYTFNSSSQIQKLYLNGTLVVSNSAGTQIGYDTHPVLIGGDNDYGSPTLLWNGEIDEASIYKRALSASEVQAIYQKGSSGKFDPTVFTTSPAQSLAEAQVNLGSKMTTTILGNNTNWQTYSVTFSATQNGTPLKITGLEPGMLLDSFSLLATNNPADPLQFNTVSNSIADHVSTIWSTNEDLSVLNSTNLTVQWSIIADSLYGTNNPLGCGSRLRYGFGDLSLNHNLYADNYNASPRLGDNISLDFVNNVIYDWGTNAGFSTNDIGDNSAGFTNQLNYVCNYLIAGTNSAMKNIAFWGGTTNTWIFQTNNFIDGNTNGFLDGENTGWNMFTNKFTEFSQPFQLIQVPTDEAFLAYEKVLDFAGPSMDKRDSADSNIVEHVRTQTGTLISSAGALPARNSVLPYLDTDQDGIPDFWEITFGQPPYVPSANQPSMNPNDIGYTDLEEYDNWLAGPHALTITNTPVGVDLMQLFGKTGNLSFSVTNGINGTVYLTNVWGTVTNTGIYSNSFAIFTPTNNASGGTNFYGYASFDAYVTNNDTVAYFGPVTVSVVVSAVPIKINSNMPPVIVTLTSGLLDPTNYGGSDFYKFTVTNNLSNGSNAVAVLFTVTNASGPVDLLANYGLPLPSLSSYEYISTNSWTTTENIVVTPSSTPVALTNGDWYLAVVNVSGSNVTYDIEATELYTVVPPVFSYPTNGNVFTDIETTPFTVTSQATDPNSPPLPLTFALVNGPTNMTVSSSGLISWTPLETQGPTTNGPSTNSISVSVSNGAFSVTNNFTIIVVGTNLPPVLPFIPNQIVVAPGTLVVTNTATNPNLPNYPLAYTLISTVPTNASFNAPAIDTNGVITWTSTLADIGSNYVFTTVVTDTNPWAINAQSLSATNSFTVTVLPALTGGQPQSNTVPAGGINWYLVSVPTNAIAATNRLLFATNLPVNVWFSTNVPPTITNANDFDLMPDVTNGVSVLTANSSPTNFIPGGVYFLGVQNTNSVPVNYALEVDFGFSNSIITVPTNSILISSIVHTNIGGMNGFLLTWFAPTNDYFQVQCTTNLVPANWLTFSNIIAYTSLTPTNGIGFFEFFDNGAQIPFGPTRFYRLLLLQATNTLTLPPQSNLVVKAGNNVTVTNAATDSNPAAHLAYSLVSAPAGGTINGTNGVITWTNATPSGLAARFTTLVTDNGVPQAQASNTFTVFVAPFPAITNITATSTNVILQWAAPTNDQFQVRWTTNLTPVITWTLYPNNISPDIFTSTNGLFTFTDTNAPVLMKFYELILLP